jgi:hypothetical protein
VTASSGTGWPALLAVRFSVLRCTIHLGHVAHRDPPIVAKHFTRNYVTRTSATLATSTATVAIRGKVRSDPIPLRGLTAPQVHRHI